MLFRFIMYTGAFIHSVSDALKNLTYDFSPLHPLYMHNTAPTNTSTRWVSAGHTRDLRREYLWSGLSTVGGDVLWRGGPASLLGDRRVDRAPQTSSSVLLPVIGGV
jgi:hypothetical protein